MRRRSSATASTSSPSIRCCTISTIPALAIREAARLLRPAGGWSIVDFAPHTLEFLRDEHAHMRLGVSDKQIADWFAEGRPRPRGEPEVRAARRFRARELTVKLLARP